MISQLLNDDLVRHLGDEDGWQDYVGINVQLTWQGMPHFMHP